MELLANLQHHRAATGFIDFTRSALVALWFATESTPADGKVFVINTDNGQFREIKPDDIRDRSISEILRFETREDEDLELAHPSSEEGLRPSRDRPQFWHWIPANLNERILAQHSLFILGPLSSGRPDTKEIIIDSGSKARIREELRDVHDIDEESLFPDFVGFAYTQRHDAIYGPTATDYFRLARNAMQRGDYSLAIQLFDNAIRHDPNYRLAYTFRGNAYERLGDIDSAIEDYSMMIELGWNRPVAYHIRAEAFELLGDFHSAIEDYSKMIEIDSSSSAAYIRRAEAYEALGEFENAIRDFSEAIRLEPEGFEYIYALRAVLYLCLEHWDHAKADFATAKNMGLDIPDFFSSEYGSVGDFEERMRVQLPNDIVHIISG